MVIPVLISMRKLVLIQSVCVYVQWLFTIGIVIVSRGELSDGFKQRLSVAFYRRGISGGESDFLYGVEGLFVSRVARSKPGRRGLLSTLRSYSSSFSQ